MHGKLTILFSKPGVINDDQVAGGDESQPTPVPDREPNSNHEPNSDREPDSNHEPNSNNEPNSDHEPDSSHEAAEPTCSSMDSEPQELTQPSANSTIDLKDNVQ